MAGLQAPGHGDVGVDLSFSVDITVTVDLEGSVCSSQALNINQSGTQGFFSPFGCAVEISVNYGSAQRSIACS